MANQTKSEATINSLRSPAKINAKKDISINTKTNKRVYKCSCCGSEYNELNKNFSPTNLPLFKDTGYYPVCKKCMDQFFSEMTEIFTGNEEQAIKYICQMTGVYFNPSPLGASKKISQHRSRLSTYVSKVQINPWIGKTYIDTLKDEERKNTISSIEVYDEKKANGEVNITKATLKHWGIGVFEDNDYSVLEEHYKMLKENNPNADNNQEIFIKSLCHLNLLMIKALKDKDLDGYTKANGEYAKTFKQAGLKTVEEKDSSNDETFCMTLGFISDYTPEEFYSDKELYKDHDNIGDYVERHITRPMINLETGSSIRDKEFFVPETDDDYDEE